MGDDRLIAFAFGSIVVVEFDPQPACLNSSYGVYAGVAISRATKDFSGNDVLFAAAIAVFDSLLYHYKAKKGFEVDGTVKGSCH